ncbi:MAG: DUF2132 domain-containing protein [Spirochaetaceae bacterium]|nr:DUF2132 domain-containing protein [Spirochaetaceae bacterium]
MQEGHEKDPLHGVTLEAMLETLIAKYGWPGLAEYVPINCFMSDPSLKSSLTFLRRTPWARAKVEALYLGKLRKPRPPRKPKSAGPHPGAAKPSSPKLPGNRYPGLFTDEQ